MSSVKFSSVRHTLLGDAYARYVSTTTNLPASSTDGHRVETLGALSKGDGGDGVWYWDSSGDKSSANGGTIFDPAQTWDDQGNGSGTGTWKRLWRGDIDPRWFGAVYDWDGSTGTDNTKAVQAAIDLAGNNGGGVVAIEGRCLCSSVTQSNDRVLMFTADNTSLHIRESAEIVTNIDAYFISVGGHHIDNIYSRTIYTLSGTYSPGATQLTLAVASDASNFQANDWILIRTGQLLSNANQQPDAEYNKVLSADSATGIIELFWPIEKSYQQESYPAGHPLEGQPAPYGVTNVSRPVKAMQENAAIYGRGKITNTTTTRPLIAGNQLDNFYFGGGLTLECKSTALSMGATNSIFENYQVIGHQIDASTWPIVIDKGNTRTIFRNVRCYTRGVAQMHVHEGASCMIDGAYMFSRNESGIDKNTFSGRARAYKSVLTNTKIVSPAGSSPPIYWDGTGKGLFVDNVEVVGSGLKASFHGEDLFLGEIDVDNITTPS